MDNRPKPEANMRSSIFLNFGRYIVQLFFAIVIDGMLSRSGTLVISDAVTHRSHVFYFSYSKANRILTYAEL